MDIFIKGNAKVRRIIYPVSSIFHKLSYNDSGTMKVDKISELTTNRLSVYLRCLNELASSGVKTTSSDDLAKRFHLNSAQIRKDLAYFGQFGVPGFGYYVSDLRNNLKRILRTDREVKVILVGVGNLGSALVSYGGFQRQGFKITMAFDADRQL